MTETTETTGTPWPSWLENLTPEQRVDVIVDAVKARYEPIGDGPYQIPAEAAKPFLLAVLEEARQGTEPADEWPATKLKAQLAVAVPALRRLALDDFMVDDRLGYAREHEARIAYAAGTLETIGRLADEQPEPAGWTDAEAAAAPDPRPLPVHLRPVPLLPDGTYVNVQIKGFQQCEGYLTAGSWHGEPYGFLADKDGAFIAAFPPVAGSVHLITAADEPGSEPEQPDPWTAPAELEGMRGEVAASRRLLAAAHLKLGALAEWAAEFLEGDGALAEVRAILERDFTPEVDDAEPPF